MKLTKKRQRILETLKTSGEAVTAKELHQQLPDIDLVTIYRALDLFVREQLVSRLHLTEGEVSYEYQHEPHHHAVCVDCDRVIHFTVKDSVLQQLSPEPGFKIEDIELTVKGKCRHT